MLSKKEKQEMKQDGFSLKRKTSFQKASLRKQEGSRLIDDYLQFLSSLPHLSLSHPAMRKKTITQSNKL